jgi:hypothetical protein
MIKYAKMLENVMNESQRLRDERPDFRLAAMPPCRFIPRRFGKGSSPFDALHSSRRDPLGP